MLQCEELYRPQSLTKRKYCRPGASCMVDSSLGRRAMDMRDKSHFGGGPLEIGPCSNCSKKGRGLPRPLASDHDVNSYGQLWDNAPAV